MHDVVPGPNDVGSQTTMSSFRTSTPPTIALAPIETAIDGSWAAASEAQKPRGGR